MPPQDPHKEFPLRLGKIMIATAWILVLALMALFFSNVLENRRNPNRSVNVVQTQGISTTVVLQRNRQGHYVATGRINGQPVEFMLDTGASDVAIPASLADTLKLRRGVETRYQTANGMVTAYRAHLDSVQLGDIEVRNVVASINPSMKDQSILLGMSFLKHLEFIQRGDTLSLRK